MLSEIGSLPGPKPWPIVGNVFQIRQDRIHQNFEAWAQRYGRLFRVRFGKRLVLVVAGHQEVAAILRQRPEVFRRPSITEKVAKEMGAPKGVFVSEGAEWRNQRRMVMAGFAPGPIKAYVPTLEKVALRLQRRWEAATDKQQTIDLSSDLKRFTVDVIAGLAFGTEVNTLESGDDVIQQHLDVMLPAVARRSLTIFPYWRYFKLPQDYRLERSVKALQEEIAILIANARSRLASQPARREKPGNLLEAMIVAADSPGSGVDDSAVSGNVSTMLLAGEDTTANTISWLLYLLHKHPECMRNVLNEIDAAAVGDQALSTEQLDSLVYLDACIQETMRLKPVGPFMPLEAVNDTEVADVRVPKGTIVWCLFRHDTVSEEFFAQAKNFEPQRWMLADNANSKKVSMPFGSGPRTCPGRYLALLEIKVAIAMILRRFNIERLGTASGQEPEELMAFVMSPIGLELVLSKR